MEVKDKGPFMISFVGEGPVESGRFKMEPKLPRVGDTVWVFDKDFTRHSCVITEELKGEWIARYFPPPKAVKL